MGRVSRNVDIVKGIFGGLVAPRMGRVSRNSPVARKYAGQKSRAPHGACE